MRTLTLLLAGLVVGCGGPANSTDAGADAGADAGTGHCIDARASCAWPDHWALSAQPASTFDAGGFSPCLPLPSPTWDVVISAEGAAYCSDARLAWASDAGCALLLEDSFTSSNPSETYRHAYALTLELSDAGARGDGSYTLTGGSNCVVPLDASGQRVP